MYTMNVIEISGVGLNRILEEAEPHIPRGIIILNLKIFNIIMPLELIAR